MYTSVCKLKIPHGYALCLFNKRNVPDVSCVVQFALTTRVELSSLHLLPRYQRSNRVTTSILTDTLHFARISKKSYLSQNSITIFYVYRHVAIDIAIWSRWRLWFWLSMLLSFFFFRFEPVVGAPLMILQQFFSIYICQELAVQPLLCSFSSTIIMFLCQFFPLSPFLPWPPQTSLQDIFGQCVCF